MINYFLNKNFKNFIFIFFPILTAVLSQSRWAVLVIFLILFLTLLLNVKNYLIELTSLTIFTILVLQFVPVFERSDPFFDINTILIALTSLFEDEYEEMQIASMIG